jgi:hypothetical protein
VRMAVPMAMLRTAMEVATCPPTAATKEAGTQAGGLLSAIVVGLVGRAITMVGTAAAGAVQLAHGSTPRKAGQRMAATQQPLFLTHHSWQELISGRGTQRTTLVTGVVWDLHLVTPAGGGM